MSLVFCSILVNCYFQVSFNLEIILNVAKITDNTAVSLSVQQGMVSLP